MRRIATPQLALAVTGVEVVLIAASFPLARIAHSQVQGAGVAVVALFAFAAFGGFVAYRRPAMRMGWIMLGVSGTLALSGLGVSYSVLDYRIHGGRLPLGWLGALIEPLWLPSFVLLLFAIVLYPEGHAPSTRWRWPLRWLGGLTSVWALGSWALVIHTVSHSPVRVLPGGDLYAVDHPAGVWALTTPLTGLVLLTSSVVLIAWFIGQAVGYRKLTGAARAQQKWIISGAIVSVLAVATNLLPYPFSSANGRVTISEFATIGIAALPFTMTVGILRYRLYEIDRIVSRTLSYAILTALLVGTFVALVVLTTRVLPFSSTVGVAASTLAAAALFNPLRVRVQRTVDRRFNRSRYDAEATVAAFAARLRDAVDLDAVQSDLVSVVDQAVQPVHVSVWLRGGELR